MIKPIAGLVYMASPYKHPDPAVREERFHAACNHAAALIRAGWTIFCPIAHGHPLVMASVPGDWATWKRIDFPILAACKAMIVLQLPGWVDSVGVAEEAAFMRRKKRPIIFLAPDFRFAEATDQTRNEHGTARRR